MKKLLFIAVAALAVFALLGCDNTTTPLPEAPPVSPPEDVIQWLDVVPGGFFQLTTISDYGTFSRSVGSVTVINDTYIVFEEDGDISVWFDHEPNGILEPEDYVGSAGEWTLVDGVLLIDGEEFFIGTVEENLWSMTLDISDEFENCLGEAGYDVTGTRTFTYERAYPVYMNENMLITTEFPFAFSDRNETGLVYTLQHSCWWWYDYYYLDEDEILLDEADGFFFTFGEVGIVIITLDDGDRSFIISETGILPVDVDGNPYVFQPDAVYDMSITVQPNDVAYYTFVSRLDEDDFFTVPGSLDYEKLGEIEIIAVNDVAGLVL